MIENDTETVAVLVDVPDGPHNVLLFARIAGPEIGTLAGLTGVEGYLLCKKRACADSQRLTTPTQPPEPRAEAQPR